MSTPHSGTTARAMAVFIGARFGFEAMVLGERFRAHEPVNPIEAPAGVLVTAPTVTFRDLFDAKPAITQPIPPASAKGNTPTTQKTERSLSVVA